MRWPIVSVVVILAGCSSLLPSPPATPQPSDITTQQASIATFTGTPLQYLNVGVSLANGWCNTYLNDLTQITNQTDFAAQSATVAGGAASGIAAAAGAGTLPLAIMGLAFPAINQELLSAGRMATAGVDPGVVLSIVQKEQGAFLGALPAAGPADTTEAYEDITAYAVICQPAGIRSAVLQAGLGATASASGNAPAGAAVARVPAPKVNVPPVIKVQ